MKARRVFQKRAVRNGMDAAYDFHELPRESDSLVFERITAQRYVPLRRAIQREPKSLSLLQKSVQNQFLFAIRKELSALS